MWGDTRWTVNQTVTHAVNSLSICKLSIHRSSALNGRHIHAYTKHVGENYLEFILSVICSMKRPTVLSHCKTYLIRLTTTCFHPNAHLTWPIEILQSKKN